MASQNERLHELEIERRARELRLKCKVSPDLATKIAAHTISRKTLKPSDMLDPPRISREAVVAACNSMEAAGLLDPKKSAKNFTSISDSAKANYNCCYHRKPLSGKNTPSRVKQHCNDKAFKAAAKEQPWLITDNKRELDALDRWLGSVDGNTQPVSDHERSYEIWGDEKALEANKTRTPRLRPLLLKLGFDFSVLRTYCASSDFASYVLPGEGKVLVSENRDMYCALKKILRLNGRAASLLGVQVCGTVFGGGSKARGDGFGEFIRDEGLDPKDMLYIGDIDPAGVAIQQDVEDKHHVKPFGALYGCMTERHAMRRRNGQILDAYTEEQDGQQYDRKRFLALLDGSLRGEASCCLDGSVRIPQEIITAEDLREMTQ